MKELRLQRLKTEDGVSGLLTTLLLPLIFGFIALVIDLGHLDGVRNQLQNADGTPATNQQKTLYFLSDCNPRVPICTTGGNNFGIWALIPVLVN